MKITEEEKIRHEKAKKKGKAILNQMAKAYERRSRNERN